MVRSKANPHIVVIGGGTGSFTLLSSLKEHTKNISALVNMADDGGSTGVLRDELGVLPPGDIRQCLVALSHSPQALRDLFNYRFPPKTTFAGHSFGNLFLSAVEMMSDNFTEAIRLAGEVLQISGHVIPMTLTKTNLHMMTDDGEIRGEYKVANTPLLAGERPRLWLTPRAKLNPLAAQALESADLIVIAPGDLYGSLIPALLVDGVGEALLAASASVVYVCNLVNKPHQTKDFGVADYASELERIIAPAQLDVVLYNTDLPSAAVLKYYAKKGEYPVRVDDDVLRQANFQAIGGSFLSHQEQARNKNDTFIQRSLIRHNGSKIALKLMELARG